MGDNYLTTELHGEFEKRMDDEHTRMNHRISNLEKSVEEINKLAISLERLTLSVQSMVEEQKKQGTRLETLESRDGKMWREVTSHIIMAIVGAVVCFLLTKLGL